MSAPSFRTVDQHTGYVTPGGSMAVTSREIDDMRTELQQLREWNANQGALLTEAARRLADARAEADATQSDLDAAHDEVYHLTTLLKASGDHVANLSSGLAMYQAERDEWRERAEDWRNRHDVVRDERDEARTRVQELSTALASAVTDCDTANARAAVL